jgi:putative aldouronate transport system permease protein
MTTATPTLERLVRKRNRFRPAWMEEPTPAAKLAKAALLTGICLLVLIPAYVIVLTSLSSTRTVNEAGGLVLIPGELTFEAYVRIFTDGTVMQATMVSTGITVVGTALSLAVTILAAYGLSRPGSLFHRPLLVMVLITFVIGPGIIPTYLVVSQLGMINEYTSLILPSAINAFNLIVMRGFFMNIPRELIDSARIDGANEFGILWRVVMPLSKAVIAVVGLFYAVGYWNAFFNALLYIDDSDKWPLQLVLRQYVVQGSPLPAGMARPPTEVMGNMASAAPLSIKMAIVVVTLLPVVIMYPFVQRHFTKGVILGAIKG